MKALRTKNVYSASTVDQMPKHVACGLVFGHPLAIPVPDLDRTDFLLLLGREPARVERQPRDRTRLARPARGDPPAWRVASSSSTRDARGRPSTPTSMCRSARGRTPRCSPGSPTTLFAEGLAAPGTLAGAVIGIDLVEAAVAGFTPERVASFTGVPADTVRSLARELAAAPTAAVYGRIGTHTTAYGTLAAWLVDVLNVVTGNLDRPGGAMFPHAAHEQPRRPPRPFQHRPVAQPGARSARDARRAARGDARRRDGDARPRPGASTADDRRQPRADDSRRRPPRPACWRSSSS